MSEHYLKKILSREQISKRVREMGEAISRDYKTEKGLPLILISILRGSVYFTVDLSRQLSIPFTLDFMSISRFSGQSNNPGAVRILKDLEVGITGNHALVVEDIVDTGLSLSYLLRNLETRRPASLRVCTLLNIEERRIVNVPLHYKGFDLPNVFVVGYGLDYNEAYRNLNYIAQLDKGP